jgi:hypothetical protein
MPDPLCHGTSVYYGGVEIRNVLTDSIDSTTVYDSTGVDPIGVKTTMTFTGEVYGTPGDYSHGHTWTSATGGDLAPGLQDTISKFLRPRQVLTVLFGDETLFYVRPAASAGPACDEPAFGGIVIDKLKEDISNGPRTTCQVLAIKGSRSAKCRFTVEFTVPLPCGDVGYNILNIRWRVSDDIECRTWLTTRTYEGMIRFRNRDVSQNPHALARAHFFPPLLRGFRRERIAYHEEPDALSISFMVVDQELHAAAPSPATFWDGTYTIAMSKHATMNTQDLTFTLKGDKTLPKGYLMTLAMYIIDSKMTFRLNRIAGDPAPNMTLLSAMFQERLSANEITVSLQMLSTGPNPFLTNLSQGPSNVPPGTIGETFGRPLPQSVSSWPANPRYKYYDPEVTTIPSAYSAGVSVLLCQLQNPCCTEEISEGPPSVTTPPIQNPSAATPPAVQVMAYSVDKTLYDPIQTKASYEYYRMASDLVSDTGWRAFPLGTQCSGSVDQPTVAFAHLHCPVQIRKITINALRINAWPELPKPVHWIDYGANPPVKHVLKEYAIEPLPVQTSADGADTIHEVNATYYYYLDRPYQVCSAYKMPVGRLPYVDKAKLAARTSHSAGIDGDKRAIDQMFFVEPKDLLETF